jgi:alkylation response protein AidB-like acyl-CoA dehydrogenase
VRILENRQRMNFEFTEEHKMIRDAARDFAQTELLPGVIERDENQSFPAEQVKKLNMEELEWMLFLMF